MRLWTTQDIQVWESLQEHKILYVDPNKSKSLSLWPYQLDWMRQQMVQHGVNGDKHYPWWAWAYPGPDQKQWKDILEPDRHQVILELSIPSDQILLSNFSTWEMILNNGYVSYTEKGYEVWEEKISKIKSIGAELQLPNNLQSELLASWSRTFEIETLKLGDTWSTNIVQATFAQLEISSVTNVL